MRTIILRVQFGIYTHNLVTMLQRSFSLKFYLIDFLQRKKGHFLVFTDSTIKKVLGEGKKLFLFLMSFLELPLLYP